MNVSAPIMERIQLPKINALLSLLYQLQLFENLKPHTLISSTRPFQGSFGRQKTRIVIKNVWAHGDMGELNLPNVRLYFWASHMEYLAARSQRNRGLQWLQIEQQAAGQINLAGLPDSIILQLLSQYKSQGNGWGSSTQSSVSRCAGALKVKEI